MTKKPRAPARSRESASEGLPSEQDILDFVAKAQGKVGKREIARAFSVKGGDRIALKRLLTEMSDKGRLAGNRKSLRQKGGLPPVAVLEVTGRTRLGDLVATPVSWEAGDGERPEVLLLHPEGGHTAPDLVLGVGDRVLTRISALEEADVEGYRFEGTPVKRLEREGRRPLGLYRSHQRGGGTIEPIDRKALRSFSIEAGNTRDAKDGDLVRFELVREGRLGLSRARIVEVLGNPQDQRQISLIAVHAHGIPDEFPPGVLAECETLPALSPRGREDLRALPLVTIDPVDARDHDDAVYAERDRDPANEGGFVVIVAIADVAHYVRSGSRLDREARLRGNSVYFPDRVVPMLPERISNDLCSLREQEDRPCLAVRMVFDRHGEKRSHTFTRALMRSAAKLSYQEAQAAFDGAPSAKCQPLMATALHPLWEAYQALAAARDRREPLALDLPERKILLDAEGRVANVVIPERLEAHRLIEEMMIQANVAAAETLEARKAPVCYRVHDRPSKEKLKALKDFLETLELTLPAAGALKPGAFNRVLAAAASLPVPELVNEVVLRSQAQAVYDNANIGHFGLNLRRYAHFTSPIRRYADLVVHRSLVRALKLGEDGLQDAEAIALADTAKSISEAERRAMAAERETIDRLIAAHLADRVGATFKGRIAGVTRSGLFVKLKDSGADGFVPISSLPGGEYYHHVEEAHALVGQRSGEGYRLGDDVDVRLVEAIPSAGALRFEMLTMPRKGLSLALKKVGGRTRILRRRHRR